MIGRNGKKATEDDAEMESIKERFEEKLPPNAGYIIRNGKIIEIEEMEDGDSQSRG